jgi:hypothetical protein
MRIGIGLSTTPNRDVYKHSFTQLFKYMPQVQFDFALIDDDQYLGIAATKNKLLSKLDQCDHIFLFDDDCYPITDDWWKPYVEHTEPHLMYQFKLPGKPISDMQEVYRDDKTVAYTHTRGAMIYLERRVLDVVGGFDPAYGKYGFEHADFTNRTHNAGLTTHRAMDVPNSHDLLYCLDQDGKVESSLSDAERRASLAKNYRYYRQQKNSKAYKEYR